MAIVKMKRLRLIALAQDRDNLLAQLLHAGCVQVSEPEGDLAGEGLLHREPSALAEAKAAQNELKQALDVVGRYAPQKGGLFTPRREVAEEALLSPSARSTARTLAGEINERAKAIGACTAREARLEAEKLALEPWRAYSLPLEEKGTRTVNVLLGTVPSSVDFSTLAGAVEEAAPACQVTLLSSDREQHCLEILCHHSCQQEALESLRTFGFSYGNLKDLTGTVEENLRRLDKELDDVRARRQREQDGLKTLGERREELQLALDGAAQVTATEEAKERLLGAGAIVCLDGWVPAEETGRLEKVLGAFDCAYELAEPTPEEYPDVPVQLKNNIFSRCMNVVTEMYSLPAYDGVDPNPLMAPFFILFFGVMMADMAYGVIMVAASLVVLLKARPRPGTRNFMELVFWCGISTFIVGAMTGGFFGDFIPQIAKIINPASTFEMPALFTPLDDTVAIMLGSLVLGLIQVVTGMTVSVIKKIKEGDFVDALFDEITWWIILAGVALAIFGIGTISGVPVPLAVGILMLVFGGTRKAKGFGKVTSLVGLVYNGVTGFFSDILSYVRLMALMLSGSVIASVFNTLGATFGNVVLFVIISMIGNALNLALNLLGCYVHDLRLQCLEFFNRFYKEGGKPYQPLAIQTKYVDVIKEEQ